MDDSANCRVFSRCFNNQLLVGKFTCTLVERDFPLTDEEVMCKYVWPLYGELHLAFMHYRLCLLRSHQRG
jgi:hypothetical protein